MGRSTGSGWTFEQLQRWIDERDAKLRRRFDRLAEARMSELCRELAAVFPVTKVQVYPGLTLVGGEVNVKDKDGTISPWEVWYIDAIRIHKEYFADLAFVDFTTEQRDRLDELFALLDLWNTRGYGYGNDLEFDVKTGFREVQR